jgi:DMSO/TMAO reductase YedYZ molybdopterin-dependent catalytic subunit
MNGAPLPPQHGAPLRLVVPGWYGMAQVKWLTRIEVLTEPFTGFQDATAHRLTVEADEDGEPVTRVEVRRRPGCSRRCSFSRVGSLRPGGGRRWTGA